MWTQTIKEELEPSADKSVDTLELQAQLKEMEKELKKQKRLQLELPRKESLRMRKGSIEGPR